MANFAVFTSYLCQKLLSQSKHEEFESNSALQIRDQKERRAENAKKLELQEKFRSLRNFRRLHCSSCENFIMQHCSPFYHYLSLTSCCPFLLFVLFLVLFLLSPCNSVYFYSFWYFVLWVGYKSPLTRHCKDNFAH